jgi:hypothetical protein
MSTSRSSWPASSASWSRTSSSPCGRCQELREERALSRHDSPKRGRCELAGAILVIDALEQAEQEAPVSHLEHAQKGWKLRVVPRLGGWRGGLYWFSRILVKGEEGGGFGSSLRESGGGGGGTGILRSITGGRALSRRLWSRSERRHVYEWMEQSREDPTVTEKK